MSSKSGWRHKRPPKTASAIKKDMRRYTCVWCEYEFTQPVGFLLREDVSGKYTVWDDVVCPNCQTRLPRK